MPTKSKASIASQSLTPIRKTVSRKRHSAAEWTKLLHKQRGSGLTVEAFCAKHRLANSTYWRWRRRLEVLLSDLAQAVPVPAPMPAPKFLAIPMNAGGEAFQVQVGEMRVRLGGVAAQRVLEAIIARIAGAA